jgi:hypothetical protein
MRIDETRQQRFAGQVNLRRLVLRSSNAAGLIDKEGFPSHETAIPVKQ